MTMTAEYTDMNWLHRTRLLVGDAGLERLRCASVAVIGLGGVGGHAAEAVARAGVGNLLLVDAGVVDETNLNRQVLALRTTLGRKKAEVALERMNAIRGEMSVRALDMFVEERTLPDLGLDPHWLVIDAIDTLESKTALLCYLHRNGISCVASMGAGQRLDPTRVRVADISATHGCPLARQVRKRLKDAGIERGIPCVFSEEPPLRPEREPSPPLKTAENEKKSRLPIGSISYVPALFGLTAAGVVINAILKGSDPS